MAVDQRDLRSGGSSCPDTEDLATYLDGTLDPAARQTVESHIADCTRCRMALAETKAFLVDDGSAAAAEPMAAPPRPVTAHPGVLTFREKALRVGVVVLAAAAAMMLAVRIAPQWMPWRHTGNDQLRELIAAVAKEPTRPVEARLSGGFTYAPPPPVNRGSATPEVSPAVQIAAARVEEGARDSPTMLASVGLARLILGDASEAVSDLEAAAVASPADAGLYANLAAAYISLGDRTSRVEDLRRALDASDKALQVDPSLNEALFNRALALERLRDPRAVAAWNAAAARERDPGWRAETRRHTTGR